MLLKEFIVLCMNLRITSVWSLDLFKSWQELSNEILWFLLNVLLREPFGHDVVGLLPVLNNLLQVLLALDHMHVNKSEISDSSIFLEAFSEG